MLKAVLPNTVKASLSYTTDELVTKRRLEKLFSRTFQKEQIGRRFIDFACEDLLIEHSEDFGKGIGDMMSRFEDIEEDPRHKIAYVDEPQLGARRRARLSAVVDEIRDIRELV